MYMLNGWWFLSSGSSYPPVSMVVRSSLSSGVGLGGVLHDAVVLHILFTHFPF